MSSSFLISAGSKKYLKSENVSNSVKNNVPPQQPRLRAERKEYFNFCDYFSERIDSIWSRGISRKSAI